MSLIQHVTAIEGVDRRDPTASANDDVPALVRCGSLGSVRHKLSYDMVAPPGQPAQDRQHQPAYKASAAKRIVQVAIAVIACWFASGIVFGFAALKPILIAEGVYEDLCSDEEPREKGEACASQDIRLNLFFAVASVTTNVSALPVGTIVDRYGRRASYVSGCLALTLGSVLMAAAFATDFDGFIPGNVFLALGGTLIFVPSFGLANAFPKYSGIIVALVTGAFDASAAVFLLYRLLYDATRGAFRPHYFFFGYLLVPLFTLLAEFAVMPARDYHTSQELEQKLQEARDATQDVHSSDDEIDSDTEVYRVRSARAKRRERKMNQIEELVGDVDERQRAAEKEEERQAASGVWGVFHGKPVSEQIRSPWFLLILLLTVLQMLRMNYFIATVDSQYSYMLNRQDANKVRDFFDYALPVGGVASTPFIGLLLDNLSVSTYMGLLTVLITVTGIFNCLPQMWAGYATVTLFVLMRPLYYSAMSDYATKIFGFATFGRIYGTIICVSGLVNFLQSALDALTLGPLEGDPTPINALMTIIAGGIGLTLTLFVHFRGRKLKEKQLREDAEESMERERLMSVAETEEEGEG